MPSTCPHGYPPESCLICRTLAASRERPAVAADAPQTAPRRRRGDSHPQSAKVKGAGTPARQSRHVAPKLVVAVLAAVAVVGVAWAVAGVVFAILRVAELLAAIAVSGWVGYRIGVVRGRRER